ncbi:MAG: hypothetical protein F4234_04185 [Gammaproteobacteria bacterium]|nr:hypothetical protein [Gammaproteobacteria bacterium]
MIRTSGSGATPFGGLARLPKLSIYINMLQERKNAAAKAVYYKDRQYARPAMQFAGTIPGTLPPVGPRPLTATHRVTAFRTNSVENLPFSGNPSHMKGHGKQPLTKEVLKMQMPMPELPQQVITAMLIIAIGQLIVAAGGGWVLYQSAIVHMNATAEYHTEQIIERLEPKIEANGERIDRNGELIAQLRERMSAVEVRVGALEELVRFFHPPENQLQQEP